MKYFIEHLMEKKLVAAESLASALAEQAAATPSPLEIVTRKKLLPPDTIVAAALFQARESTSFTEACKRLGAWTPELERTLREESKTASPSLTAILTRLGLIGFTELSRALDEFLADAPKAAAPALTPVSSLAPVPAPEAPGEDPLDPLIPERDRDALLLKIAALASPPDIETFHVNLRALLQSLKETRGMASLRGAVMIASLFENAEKLVLSLLTRTDPLDETLLERVRECLATVVQTGWRASHDFFPIPGSLPEEVQNECLGLLTQLELYCELIRQPSETSFKGAA